MGEKVEKISRNFTADDFLSFFKSAQFAGFILLLLFLVMGVAFFCFYKIALPVGFSHDKNVADAEALLFALIIDALAFLIFAHENFEEQRDAFSMGMITFYYLAWLFLLLVNPFEMWWRVILMRITIFCTLPVLAFVLVLILKTKLSK
jgi:hypothetical protein